MPIIESSAGNTSESRGQEEAETIRHAPGEGECKFAPAPHHSLRLGLPQRLALLGGLGILELLAISVWLDTAALVGSGGLARMVGDWGPAAVQWTLAFAALWLTFVWPVRKRVLKAFPPELAQIPVAWRLLLGHLGALVVFVGLSFLLFQKSPSPFRDNLLAGGWLAVGVLALVLAASALLSPKLWFVLISATRAAATYAAIGASGAALFGTATHALWKPVTRLTFALVQALLGPFLAGVNADPSSMTIGSQRFSVAISPQCSGMEGVGLMLIFGAAWLWFFRHECRFPQALLLIPAGVILIWVLNAGRITVLILIGNAGAPGVAAGGFHSQAGWIAFNMVALGFCLALRRVPWMMQPEAGLALEKRSAENPTAPYLIPLLAILAAGMVSRALSAGFEWLYPLRFLAGGLALWFFRRRYANLDWRFGWFAMTTGVVVLIMWLGLDMLAGNHTTGGMPYELASLALPVRVAWIAVRTLAAIITVPIAEELAFRGFLIRRVISAHFESLDPRMFTYPAVLLTSIAFGLLHGERWLAGTVAGMLYAVAFLRRGRIGDAVAAHATTNALLAGWVLLGGNWRFW